VLALLLLPLTAALEEGKTGAVDVDAEIARCFPNKFFVFLFKVPDISKN
jgi:hypothetical protein